MQRTLSQMMTKEFLLISRGTHVAEYKVKLHESMSSFNSTLYGLMHGDSARDIIPAPNSQVANALQQVLTEWTPMHRLLRNNIDTVRRSDGWVDMLVLEELNSRNVPLLDTSDAVVKALVDAAQVSGASTNGLVQDIAGRQRTLIQRLAKGILLLSQGVAMSFNMEAYRSTKSLFEASHDGIIQGVPFAGLPVLRQVCTLHQMREVTFYYQKLRPLLTGITNADTPSTSQKAADAVAEEVVELVDPLFYAMVDAVKLFGTEDESCDPSNSTYHEWLSFFATLSKQRLLTQKLAQYFTQVGLRVDVKTSQVEITVLLSQASGNLRNLIEGNTIRGIPAPPSQDVVDKLLHVASTWKTFESELQATVHLESVPDVSLFRVELLAKDISNLLEDVMHLAMPMLVNSTVPAEVDMSIELALMTSEMTQAALHILFDQDVSANWDIVNASRIAFETNRWKLLQGSSTGEVTRRVTDVCIVQQVKTATDLFRQVEEKVLGVAHGNSEDLDGMIQLSPMAVDALELSATSLAQGNATCGNGTMTAEDWHQLHREAARVAMLSTKVSTEFVLLKQEHSHNRELLDTLVTDLDSSMRRIMFGSYDPPVVAPTTQSKFDHMLNHLEPSLQQLKEASLGANIEETLRSSQALTTSAQTLQEQYLVGAEAADPQWPGKRVDLATSQLILACQVFQEAVLYASDLSTSDAALRQAIHRFEVAHHQLKDGGSGFSAIMMPERQDLMDQWDRVNAAWAQVKSYQSSGFQVDDLTRTESAVRTLVDELQNLLPLLAMEDLKSPDKFPWSILVYSIISAIICTCCCFMVCVPWCMRQSKNRAEAAAKAQERNSMQSMTADGV